VAAIQKCFIGSRLDVDGQHAPGEPGQEPGLDQRRLAAARWAVDQADTKSLVGIRCFDPPFPEPEALGQAVAVARTGQELEEKMGVVLVERPQALGDDLDGRVIGVGSVAGHRGGRRRRDVHQAGRGADGAGGRHVSGCGGLRPDEMLQVVGQVAGGGVPLGRALRDRLQADSFQLPGNRIIDLAGRAGVERGDLLEHLGRRFTPKRPPARQELIEDDPQAEDVPGHDVAEAVIGSSRVIDRNDVGMVECGDDARLAQIRLHIIRLDDALGVGNLDRHRAGELVVVSEIDPPEAALTQAADHKIAADGGGIADMGRGIRSLAAGTSV